jgi:hypothetical protein
MNDADGRRGHRGHPRPVMGYARSRAAAPLSVAIEL